MANQTNGESCIMANLTNRENIITSFSSTSNNTRRYLLGFLTCNKRVTLGGLCVFPSLCLSCHL